MNQNIKNFIEEGEKELLEELAELEHQQWCDWSRNLRTTEKLTPERIMRWEELWINYKDLPEDQKESDRKYARKVLEKSSSRQISLIKMIKDMVESEKKDALDKTRDKIVKDGYGYLYERLIGHNIALDTISSKLTSLIKE